LSNVGTLARSFARPDAIRAFNSFARAAYAIRFAIEELPPELFPDACIEVNAVLLDCDAIRRLYDSEDYPLVRRAVPVRRVRNPVERMSQSAICFKA
jgi:hypothetical protein